MFLKCSQIYLYFCSRLWNSNDTKKRQRVATTRASVTQDDVGTFACHFFVVVVIDNTKVRKATNSNGIEFSRPVSPQCKSCGGGGGVFSVDT